MIEPVTHEVLPPETGSVFIAMQELRPSFTNEADFVSYIDDVLRAEGYRLVAVFERSEPQAVAVAGFRVQHMLSRGRFMYVDDLSTQASARRRGHGRRLMLWLLAEAHRLGCAQLHLDSGVGSERIDAHRLYFNSGLAIAAYHFARATVQEDRTASKAATEAATRVSDQR